MAVGEAGVQAPPGEVETARSRRRRRWLPVVFVLVLALLVGGGIWVLVWAHTYKGLDYGELGEDPSPTLQAITDGVNDTYLIDTGRRGSTAWLEFSLANDGDHEVTIEGLAPNSEPVDLRWGPLHFLANGGMGSNTVPARAASRPFPAHIGGGQQILLFVEVQRPACQPSETAGIQQFTLTWSALDVHHQFTVNFGTANAPLPVLTCYPAAALHHINHSPGASSST